MDNIIMYTTQWCGDCRTAKRFLREKNIAFTEVDIDRDEIASQQVIQWSGGRRVIPTLLIECRNSSSRIILHNPPLSELAKVAAR